MRQGTVEAVLRLLGVSRTSPSGKDWLQFPCPLASVRHQSGEDHRPSCAVKFGTGPAYVVCHACGFRGVLDTLVRACRKAKLVDRDAAARALTLCDAGERLAADVPDAEPEATPPRLDPAVLTYLGRHCRYFTKRGFTPRETKRWRLGWHKRMALLPCVLTEGIVPYVQVRLMDEKRFWWLPGGIRRQHVAGAHLLPPDGMQRLVVVEGIFDALRTERALRRLDWTDAGVVALFGSKPSDDVQNHLFSLVRHELIILTDNDDAGDLCADQLTRVGRKRVPLITRVTLPSDVKDPDAAGTPVLRRMLPRRRNVLVTQLHHFRPRSTFGGSHESKDRVQGG